jgi:hypothetical protein
MKAIKGLGLFVVLGIVISSCFNPPEFAIEPVITLDDMYLIVSNTPSVPDSLVIILSFKDGDGDLGLENTLDANPAHFFSPFNIRNFYLTRDNQLVKIASGPTNFNAPRFYDVIDVLEETGKLVTKRTIDRGNYPGIPAYSPGSCVWAIDTMYVDSRDGIIDKSTVNVIDSVTKTSYPKVYVVVDTFYVEQNPYRNNITVEFWEQPTNGGDLVPVNFGNACLPAFDGRFPVLSYKDEGTPLEGVLTYSLKSNEIRNRLTFNFFKLKIKIQDRALHTSNEIETKLVSIDKLLR